MQRKCWICGAGEFTARLFSPAREDLVIAADGGLRHTQNLGVQPGVILGDFDSLGYIPQGAQVFPVEKDDTDSMLAVRKGLELGYRRFEIYGSLDGERLDHTIANLQTLVFLSEHGAIGYLVGLKYMATTVCNSAIRFSTEASGIVSVFCLGKDAKDVSLTGLQYSLEKGTLTSGFPLGVSNHFVGESSKISVGDGIVMVLYDVINGFPTLEDAEC